MSKLPIPDYGNNEQNDDVVDKSVASSLDKLTILLSTITEYKPRKLLALSLLIANNKYIADMLGFYIDNIKHIKRKHSKEIMGFTKYITNYATEQKRSLLNKLNPFNRNSNLNVL